MAFHIHRRLWRSFLQLNLYKTSSSDINTAPKELLATRLYVCSLALVVLIIAIVATFLLRTVNNTEYSPSITRFSYLVNKYPATLYCPCSTIGIAYDRFVTTHARFHQVCSSYFVQQTWIDLVFTPRDNTSLDADDFRTSLSFFWQVIAGLCNISNTTWYDVVATFNATLTFNPVAVTEQTVRMAAETSLNNAISLAQTRLSRKLLGIQRMMSGNQIVSALATNFHLRYPPDNAASPRMSPRVYGNCSCLRSQGCPHSATTFDTDGHLVTIPGMVADCFVMDGTLASTLECYYNQSCLSLLHPSFPVLIQPLVMNSNKHFTIKSTVEMLLKQIMIDEVISNVRFDLYYSECNPTYCFYSYTHRFDVLFIVTTIIGIYGSVSLVLQIVAPLVAAVILRWKKKHKATNNQLHVATPQRRKCEFYLAFL